MPKTISGDNPHRKKFEEVYGRTIRHEHWLKICCEMREAGLKIDMRTISFYANFKKLHPRKPITQEALKRLETFTSQYSMTELSGRDLRALIKSNSEVSDNAIYKSFYKAGLSFKEDKLYSFDECYRVVTFAYTIRPRRESVNVSK